MSKSKDNKRNDYEKRIKRVGKVSRQAGDRRALTKAAHQYVIAR